MEGPAWTGSPFYESTAEVTVDIAVGALDYFWPVLREQIKIALSDGDSLRPPAVGEWQIQLSPRSGAGGRVDFYMEERHLGSHVPDYGFTAGRDDYGVIESPASADSVIGVGAYSTKSCWTTAGGVFHCDSQSDTLGNVYTNSSSGPRRDGVLKPDLAAPGAVIVSTRSANAGFADTTAIAWGGKHVALSGTSMAAPHVTGAVALLLAQPDSGWAQAPPSRIKARLQGTCRTDNFTGLVPNNTWGYGKLDVSAALAPVFSVRVLYPARDALIGPAPDSVTVLVGGNLEDSVVFDLSADTCRTYSTRTGRLVGVPPNVPRSISLFVVDSLVSSYAAVRATAYAGAQRVSSASEGFFVLYGPVAVEETRPEESAKFALGQNAPNPFNPVTAIRIGVPRTSPVTLRVYAVDGRLVRTLVDGPLPRGVHSVKWDGRDNCGVSVASGVYVCEARSGGLRLTRKMTVLK